MKAPEGATSFGRWKGMTFVAKDPILRFVYGAAEYFRWARRLLTESHRKRYRPEQHYMRGPGPKFRAADKDSRDRSTTSVN
jgi:hypothetical protein